MKILCQFTDLNVAVICGETKFLHFPVTEPKSNDFKQSKIAD